jgi:hypothetical protein
MSNPRNFCLAFFLVSIVIPEGLKAQNESWKSRDWQIGAGSTYIYDDYLSPVSYNSISYRISTEKFSPFGQLSGSDDCRWFNQCYINLLPAIVNTRSGTEMYHLQIDLKNTTFYKFPINTKWSLYTGAFLALRGGGRFVYQTRNNPGSADIITDFGVALMAEYNFDLWGKNFKARYLGNIALAGLAFSPEYSQSYYEIFYLGNFNQTIKFTSPFNKRQWLQQLSIDIPFNAKKSSLRLSYWNEGRMSILNKIDTRVISDQFSVGYIRYFKVL